MSGNGQNAPPLPDHLSIWLICELIDLSVERANTKGGLNSKLHMLSDGGGRPLTFFLAPGQISDARGALVLLAKMPCAKRLIGDKGHDADWLRDELKARNIRVCVPAHSGRTRPASHSHRLYGKRCRMR